LCIGGVENASVIKCVLTQSVVKFIGTYLPELLKADSYPTPTSEASRDPLSTTVPVCALISAHIAFLNSFRYTAVL
jgi:hypothetical protein